MIDFKGKIEDAEEKKPLLEKILDNEAKISPEEKKRKRRLKKYSLIIILLLMIFLGKTIMSSPEASQWISHNIFGDKFSHLVLSGDKKLLGEDEDRVNILLLGMGGEGHDGAYLTDTIMILSLKPSSKEVALLSIPRDLSVPTKNSYWYKINSINAIAEAKKPGSGPDEVKDLLGSLLGLDISYYVNLDFKGFEKIINELDGIDVNVENAFDDYMYPILGQEDNPDYYSRFEHLHFDAGLQHMDGSRALKYARSRHALGIEGSDFARSKRQQLILQAVKEKLLKRSNLLRPAMISRILSEFNKNIRTNFSNWELLKLWNEYKDIDIGDIKSKYLDDGPSGMLVASKSSEGAYILIPQTGNFKAIKESFLEIFDGGSISKEELNLGKLNNINNEASFTNNSENKEDKSNSIEQLDLVDIEKVQGRIRVAVLNGTWVTGLAAKNAIELERFGFEISETSNAPTREYDASFIYDLSLGQKLQALEILQAVSGANLAYDAPSWLETYKNSSTRPDFVLIVSN